MAVTEIWPINVRLDKFIAYVVNKDKTENDSYEALQNLLAYDINELKTEKKMYVTGINCEPENAYKKMKEAYYLNDKPMPNIAYHAYQSFRSGEVDARTAHKIGVKMAEQLWGDKFHVVVATHLNTDHFHNHFAICSTSFIDGSRYHDDKETIDTNTYGRSDGMRGSFSTNWQISGRELMTPDEVRLLDNKYALLFIRGERPIIDEKFDILKHPNIALTEDGNAGVYNHGEATDASADIGFEITNDMSIVELKPYESSFYLLSEEDVEANIMKNGGINFDEENEFGKENHDKAINDG